MNLNTGLIILTICSSFFFAPNTFAQNSIITIAQEQVCRSSVQGRVAWNRAGNKSWQASNLNELCRGTNNARATVNCFKAQIRSHNNWSRGINACKRNTNASASTRAYTSASTSARPPRRPTCIKPDCYDNAKLIRGGIVKLGPVKIVNDVKYGFHCGNGRGSDKKNLLNQVDAACEFHDSIGGGNKPYTNGNGVTLAQFCSRQLQFVEKLRRINSSRITNGERRAKQMLLAQFPPIRELRSACNTVSTGEAAVVGTKKTAVGTANWVERGILGASSNEWRVEIDSCHKDLNNEGTKNTITVEFWSKNKKVKSKSRRGVKANCILNREFWSIKSNYKITHVIVKTNGTDGFYLDEVELFKGGKSRKRHGRDNGSGWCLSKDPKDGSGAWRGKVSKNKCVTQKMFTY